MPWSAVVKSMIDHPIATVNCRVGMVDLEIPRPILDALVDCRPSWSMVGVW